MFWTITWIVVGALIIGGAVYGLFLRKEKPTDYNSTGGGSSSNPGGRNPM